MSSPFEWEQACDSFVTKRMWWLPRLLQKRCSFCPDLWKHDLEPWATMWNINLGATTVRKPSQTPWKSHVLSWGWLFCSPRPPAQGTNVSPWTCRDCGLQPWSLPSLQVSVVEPQTWWKKGSISTAPPEFLAHRIQGHNNTVGLCSNDWNKHEWPPGL